VTITALQQAMRGLLTSPPGWGSSVGTATGYGIDGRGSISGKGKGLFSSTQSPNRLRSPPSPLFNMYRGAFSGGKEAGP
jgi:hypothetical protein